MVAKAIVVKHNLQTHVQIMVPQQANKNARKGIFIYAFARTVSQLLGLRQDLQAGAMSLCDRRGGEAEILQ